VILTSNASRGIEARTFALVAGGTMNSYSEFISAKDCCHPLLPCSAGPEASPQPNARSQQRGKMVMVTPVPDAGIRAHRKAPVVNAIRDGALTDADFRGCRWIDGDPSPLRPGMFCGCPVASGESWCAKHRGVVFGENFAVEFRPQGLAGRSAARWPNRRSVGFSPAPNRHEQ
jgi:hypothetical protein